MTSWKWQNRCEPIPSLCELSFGVQLKDLQLLAGPLAEATSTSIGGGRGFSGSDAARDHALTASLSNVHRGIYAAELPAGAMSAWGRKFKFRNREAMVEGGFAGFHFFSHREGYRFQLSAYAHLSLATVAEMTAEVYFGGQQFVHSATWIRTKRGWRETGHTPYTP